MSLRPLLLFALLAGVCGCAGDRPHPKPGRKFKLETVTHDWQTTYVYREQKQ